MARLSGKICLITGAASGIGAAAARRFAQEGAQVVGIDVDAEGLATVAGGQPAIEAMLADVCKEADLERMRAMHPRVDVLFNCAGTVAEGDLLACSDEQWNRSFELNVAAVYRCMRTVLPSMLAAGGGSIINMASVISSLGSAPDRFAYGATKAAVIGMTRSVSRDYAGRGIRCNAICPSAVDTPSMQRRIRGMPDPEAARRAFCARQPVGRMAEAREIADLALYLASDESRFTTGASLVIDGGTWA